MAISFVAGASGFINGSSGLILNVPAGTQSGDYMLAFVQNAALGTAITPPAGWTALDPTNSGSTEFMSTYYRIAGGAEPASYTWTVPSLVGGGIVVTYRGVNTIDVHGLHNGASLSAGTGTVGPLTTTAADLIVVGFGASNTNTWSTPTSYTPRTAGPANTVELATFDQQQSGSGSTGTVSSTFGGGSGAYGAAMIALSPPPTETFCMVL